MHQKPNILFLVLDAVRVDHVSCYGYNRETTPNIDIVAEEGLKFENAFAPSIWTPTVHGAIFTGRYPSHTGIYGDTLAIPSNLESLPETLKKEGYNTFVASAGAHIRASRGYGRDVDDYVSTRRISPDLNFIKKVATDPSFAKQVAYTVTRGPDDKTRYKFDRLRKFINRSVKEENPFFGFINAKTAHQPFNPPRPYKQLFSSDLKRPRFEFTERLRESLGLPGQQLPGYEYEKIREISNSGGDEILAGEIELNEEEWDVIRSWYDGAIRYLDDLIGELLSFLKKQGIYEESLVIITSDHGDHFGDHGLTSHIFSLYDTLLHVPLVIKPPHHLESGETIDEQVTLIDLHRTFCEVAGAPDPNPDYQLTTSLLPGRNTGYHEYTFAEYAGYAGPVKRLQRKFDNIDTSKYQKTLQSIRSPSHKLIVESTGKRELYDWRGDPNENQNLFENNPELGEKLETVLKSNLGSLTHPESFSEPDDEELAQQLRDLGYM